MRITSEQQALIKAVIQKVLGRDATVSLFGSRLDDSKRGGDVDLLVEMPSPVDSRVMTEARLAARIERALEGRQVDVLLVDPTTVLQPAHLAARAHGVRL